MIDLMLGIGVGILLTAALSAVFESPKERCNVYCSAYDGGKLTFSKQGYTCRCAVLQAIE